MGKESLRNVSLSDYLQEERPKRGYTDVTDIQVDVQGCRVFVNRSSDGTLEIIRNDTDRSVLDMQKRGKKLKISQEEKMGEMFRGIFLKGKSDPFIQLEIRLPEEGISSLRIVTGAGDIRISRAVLKKLDLSSFSGEIQVEGSDIEDGEIGTTSGNIYLEHSCFSKKLTVASPKGNILSEDVYAPRYAFETVSGDITLDVPAPMGEYDVEITYYGEKQRFRGEGTGKCSIKTVSGKITYGFTED